jgi:hypothetical protein
MILSINNTQYCHYAECHLFIVMLNIVMLSVLGPPKLAKFNVGNKVEMAYPLATMTMKKRFLIIATTGEQRLFQSLMTSAAAAAAASTAATAATTATATTATPSITTRVECLRLLLKKPLTGQPSFK